MAVLNITVRRGRSGLCMRADYSDGQDATSVSVATAARAIQMKQSRTDRKRFCVSVNCSQRNMWSCPNQINNLALFLSLVAHCFIPLQSLFFGATRNAVFTHPSTAQTPATRPLQAVDQIASHHGRQWHPGLCPSAGCSPDHAIQRRSHTKGPGTRVPRTIPKICMRHYMAHGIHKAPTNDFRTKHGTQPS